MKRVLIIGDTRKPKIQSALQELNSWLKERAQTVILDLAQEEGKRSLEGDIAVVLGGDGAFLRASRMVSPFGIPLVGVHLGAFGFLAELTPTDMYDYLEKALRNECRIVPRMLLNCRLERGQKVIKESLGVNDAVISRSSLSRLISIRLFIDEEEVTVYGSDGLIVSTPMGSTAHCLAAGGPILSPDLDAFVILPICPHTLTNRPLVISSDSRIEMEPTSEGVEIGLTVDGQVYEDILPGDRIKVERARLPLRFVDTGIRSFYAVLREKLAWGGSPKYGSS